MNEFIEKLDQDLNVVIIEAEKIQSIGRFMNTVSPDEILSGLSMIGEQDQGSLYETLGEILAQSANKIIEFWRQTHAASMDIYHEMKAQAEAEAKANEPQSIKDARQAVIDASSKYGDALRAEGDAE